MPVYSHVATAPYEYNVAVDGRVHRADSRLAVTTDCAYRVGDERIERAFASTLPEALPDLVAVALAVYSADRLSRRSSGRGYRYHPQWSRQIVLHVTLQNPDRWNEGHVLGLLKETLAFFTEDDWHFDFVPSPARRKPAIQPSLFPHPPRWLATTVLFSGGLDSLAGLAIEMDAASQQSFVLCSAMTISRTGQVQQHLCRELQRRRGPEVIPIGVPLGLKRHGHHYNDDERSQRTRGFVHMALGAVTALVAGGADLAIYENGIGAMNLPCTAAQLGTHLTRATHPVGVALMNELVCEVTGRHFTIRSPFLFWTKGQMCQALGELGDADLIRQTVSCDGFPPRVAGAPQCGLCTSCLLRRQAIHAAGLQAFDPPANYRTDVLRLPAGLPQKKLLPLRAMLDQIARLEGTLAAAQPGQNLVLAYPGLLEVGEVLKESAMSAESRLVAVYREYVEEWSRFPLRLSGWSTASAA